MIYQLEKHIADLLKDFFKNYEFVDKVVVFGSRAKHNANPKSDIDLCVYSSKMSDKEFSKLRLEMDDLPILQKLDVVYFEKVNAELQNNVEKDGKLLYKKLKKVKIKDIGKVVTGKTPSKRIDEYWNRDDVPFLKPDDLTKNINLLKNYNTYLSNEGYLKANKIPKNSVVVSCIGTIGKVGINNIDIATNQQLNCIIPNEDMDSKYLMYQMFSKKNYLNDIANAPVVPIINKTTFENIEISNHPLEQQKQIAKTLDKANELIELRKESITKLDALVKSIFIDMFGDPIGNPKDWEIKKIVDLGKVQTGNTPPRIESDNYGDFIEWIKSDNILKDKMIITEAREYLSEKGYRKGRIADKSSLLFTCIAGSMSSIGNLAITDRQVTFNQQINSLTPFNNNELYLYSLFKLCKKFFEENSTKSMKIMINKSTFENLLFPIAPIDLQNKFAKIIEKIEEQKSLYEKELELLQNNFDALLQKSFQE